MPPAVDTSVADRLTPKPAARELFSSLVEVLELRAAEQPSDAAYIFVSERGSEEGRLTFADLDRQARAVAAQLLDRARPGDRALLLFPSGLDFIRTFFACLLAGVIPVPMMIPRRASSRDAANAILADCSPRLAVTTRGVATTRPDVIERFQTSECECMVLPQSQDPQSHHPSRHVRLPAPTRDDIAFLQYTSGSTSQPKGVMVSHGNLLANSEMIRIALGTTRASTFVSWVPHYHDLGLILNILQTLYVGAPCVLMAPVSFMQRPLGWLKAIHAYRAEVATGPNFAFDLCVLRFRPEQMQGLDLSSWKVVPNGAEPVRADTLHRFASTFAPYGFDAGALYPAYGLAEATLLVSAGRRGHGVLTREVSRAELQQGRAAPPARSEDAQVLVSCGHALVGERIAIVDPESRRRCGTHGIGEIWVNGPNVTKGYWQNAAATETTFRARIEGEGDDTWLRTGDLGFLSDTGDLFVTGRIKDVIIVRGMNHYPQDIENTVQNIHPALTRNGGAAFTSIDEDGREKLVVIQEVERRYRHHLANEDLVDSIREAVVDEHEINIDEILFIGPGALPKTTSGKIQRALTRKLWLAGQLDLLE